VAGGVFGSHAIVNAGYTNSATCYYSTVSNGYMNTASNYYSTIINGKSNNVSGCFSTILGGCSNTASHCNAYILGKNITTSRPDTAFANSVQVMAGGFLYMYDTVTAAYRCVSIASGAFVIT
jgi:hypothetical protein